MEPEQLARMRAEYGSVEKDGSADLDADWVADGWLVLFNQWMGEAHAAGLAEPNAMVVGDRRRTGQTGDAHRVVQERREEGISFYTNYDSAKGQQLAIQPYASATFPWYGLGRQIHVRGPVIRVSAEATADYWSKRPRGSQLGAWASQQSAPIASRAALLGQLADVTARFADLEAVPVPPNWGGYLIAPEVVEFWQGRENRVHNRIRVTPRTAGWSVFSPNLRRSLQVVGLRSNGGRCEQGNRSRFARTKKATHPGDIDRRGTGAVSASRL